MGATRSSARIVTTALVVTVLFGTTFHVANAVKAPEPTVVKKTKNLIKNPGAEAGTGSSDGTAVAVPNWTRGDGSETQVKYGASGGFPDAHTPGPPNRGKNFFAGGLNVSTGHLSQSISLRTYRTAINAGHVTFAVKAWLGGWANDTDNASVYVSWEDAHGESLGHGAVLGPVTHTQRHDQTKFLSRSASGAVPKGAVSAFVLIVMDRVSGGPYNDGYADNLSLILSGV